MQDPKDLLIEHLRSAVAAAKGVESVGAIRFLSDSKSKKVMDLLEELMGMLRPEEWC